MLEKKTREMPPKLPVDNRKKESRKLPVISFKEVIRIIKDNCGEIQINKYGNGRDYLIILPEAWEELKIMIGWGKRTPANVFEQLYQGMGYYFSNPEGNRILVVTHFLYIYAANRSPVSACINNGEHNSIMSRLEYEREVYCNNEAKYNISPEGYLYNPFVNEFGCSEVNLYGHTHPDIGVFFSYDDKTSGCATPDMPAATFVADPIRKQIKAMVGNEQSAARVVVCSYCFGHLEKSESGELFDTDRDISSRKGTRQELIAELGRICNELLNPEYGSKGNYYANTTMTGKEHIKVDIKIRPKLNNRRKKKLSFDTSDEKLKVNGNAYV